MFMRGDVRILRAPWNGTLIKELLEFPSGDHDDQVDALGLIGRRFALLSSPAKAQPVVEDRRPLRMKAETQPDGSTRHILQMPLNDMFDDYERRLRANRGRI